MNNSFIWVGVRVFLGCVLFYCMCGGIFGGMIHFDMRERNMM